MSLALERDAMLALASILRSLSRTHHSRVWQRAYSAAIAGALALWVTPTWARDQPEPDKLDDLGRRGVLGRDRDHRIGTGAGGASAAGGVGAADSYRPDFELGVRAFSGYGPPKDIEGVFGLSLDAVWMRTPRLGFGAAWALLVGNLAGEYFQDGVFNNGIHALFFAEGDLLEGWVSPYARLGFGLGNYERYSDDQYVTTNVNVVAELEGGVALRLSHLVMRLSAAPSFYGKDFWVVLGGQLGARF